MGLQYHHRLAFLAEWFQEEAGTVRTFTVSFYPMEGTIEIYDRKVKRMFLRRTKMLELNARDFFLGSKLNIFGRQFEIVDYADLATKNLLEKYNRKTFFLLKNSILRKLGSVLSAIIESGIQISRATMVQFTAEQVKAFLKDVDAGSDTQVAVITNQLLTGPCVGMELMAHNIVEKMSQCLASNEECSEPSIPMPLRILFQNHQIRNGIYTSGNDKIAERDLNFFFSPSSGLKITCTLENSTLAVIKPHCIKEGNLGKIITDIINAGFVIAGLRMLFLERVNCEEFLEVYHGILPEYTPWVIQLASGSCVALEICYADPKKDSYADFRNFCGPMDPEIAKILRPHTLRAQYGYNKTLNSIHCTDLHEDTLTELQYLFKIIE